MILFKRLLSVTTPIAAMLLMGNIDSAHAQSNMAQGAKADGSSKASGSSYGKVVDGNNGSYWQPKGSSGERISVKGLSGSSNRVVVRELNNATNRWRLVDHKSKKVLASGSGLGSSKSISYSSVNAQKISLYIDSASRAPQIAEIEVYGGGGGGGGDNSGSSGSSDDDDDDDGGNSGSGNIPTPSGIGSSCKSSKGTVTFSETKKINGTFDGGCKTYRISGGDCSQKEGQKAIFRVESGTLKNVIVGPTGDGIHIWGDSKIENVYWPNVCEDALTIKKPAKVTITNITGYDASDKFFQANAKADVVVRRAYISGAGKVLRENGGKCYPVKWRIEDSEIRNVKEAIFRSDCNKSEFSIKNVKTSGVSQVCYSKGKYKSCKVE